jgi:SurA N-terminal domain
VSLRVAFLTLACAAALTGAGCGDDDGNGGGGGDGNGSSGSSADLPSNVVATVGDQEITKAELRRRVAALERAQPRLVGRAARKGLQQQAVTVLLQQAWLEQEAAEQGVEVTNAQVRRRWEDASKDQFKTKQALRQFLGRQKLADLLFQLRIQALTEAVSAEAIGDRTGKDAAKASADFQTDFQERWKDETTCADAQMVPLCGNAPS